MFQFSGMAARALAVLAVGSLLVGGSAGVSAAFGGPNVPSQVIELVRGGDDDRAADATVAGSTYKGNTHSDQADATEEENASSTAGHSKGKLTGPCNAITRGSDKGIEQKKKATLRRRTSLARP